LKARQRIVKKINKKVSYRPHKETQIENRPARAADEILQIYRFSVSHMAYNCTLTERNEQPRSIAHSLNINLEHTSKRRTPHKEETGAKKRHEEVNKKYTVGLCI